MTPPYVPTVKRALAFLEEELASAKAERQRLGDSRPPVNVVGYRGKTPVYELDGDRRVNVFKRFSELDARVAMLEFIHKRLSRDARYGTEDAGAHMGHE